jgi:DNA-binding response OmpR family regulator
MLDRREHALKQYSDRRLLEECERRGWVIRKEITVVADERGSFKKYLEFCEKWDIQPTKQRGLILELLLYRSPSVVTYEALTDFLWGDQRDGGPQSASQSIKVVAHWLRKALEPTPYRVETVVGVGLRLLEE